MRIPRSKVGISLILQCQGTLQTFVDSQIPLEPLNTNIHVRTNKEKPHLMCSAPNKPGIYSDICGKTLGKKSPLTELLKAGGAGRSQIPFPTFLPAQSSRDLPCPGNWHMEFSSSPQAGLILPLYLHSVCFS